MTSANIPPWSNINTVSIVFSKPVSGVAAAGLSLGDSGNNGGTSSGITINGESNPSTTVATFTLSGPLTSNKYYLDLLSAGITDSAGAALDGEWTTSASTFSAGSGDGAPGGNFIFRFNVVAGDASHDGKVSSSDTILVRNQTGQNDNATNYRDDINGDGKMSSSDMILVRNQTGVNIARRLPGADPAQRGSHRFVGYGQFAAEHGHGIGRHVPMVGGKPHRPSDSIGRCVDYRVEHLGEFRPAAKEECGDPGFECRVCPVWPIAGPFSRRSRPTTGSSC